MRLRNTNPLGAVDLPLIGKSLRPGEVFEVEDEQGTVLLEQVGNYASVSDDTPLGLPEDHEPQLPLGPEGDED